MVVNALRTLFDFILAAVALSFGGLMLLGSFFALFSPENKNGLLEYIGISISLMLGAGSLALVFYLKKQPTKRKANAERETQQKQVQAEQQAKRNQIVAEQQAKQIQSKLADDRGAAAVHRIEQSLNNIFLEHAQALSVQFRKLRHTDAYGKIVLDRWENELAYFRSSVLEPAIDSADYETAMLHVWRSLDEDTQMAVCELHGENAICKYYDLHIDSYIGSLVQGYVEDHPIKTQDNIDEVSPTEFEQLCAERLKNAGWATQVSAGSGDQGVDIVAQSGETTAVFQCKRYSKPLGNTPVQEVFTGKQFYKAQIAAVVTNADYTPGARAAAEQTGVYLLHYSELDSFSPSRFSEQ